MPIVQRDSSRSRLGRSPAPAGRSNASFVRALAVFAAVVGLSLAAGLAPATAGASTDTTRVSVSNPAGTVVDPTGFPATADASLTSGACAADTDSDAATLPDGEYSFLVSTADGTTPLSTDGLVQRELQVVGGHIVSTSGDHATNPRTCAEDPTTGGPITVALAPFAEPPTDALGVRVSVALSSSVRTCVGSGDPTGFGCPNLGLRSMTFTIAGTAASATTAAVNASTIAFGRSVIDQASVTGASNAPTGSVVFFICPGSTCAQDGSPVGSTTLEHGNATSPAFTPPVGGTWTFRAEYWGDSTYAASSAASSGQTLTVTGGPEASGSAIPASATPPASSSVGPSASSGTTGSPGAPSASAGQTASPTATTGGTGPTPTPAPSGTPRPTASRSAAPTPDDTSTLPAGPIKTGTPPPPPQRTAAPTVTNEPVKLGPGGCTVCYRVSPTFFGPGYDQPLSAPPTSLTGYGTPNPSAVAAYGPGGVPHFPGINAPATPPPAGGAGGAAPVPGTAGSGTSGPAAPAVDSGVEAAGLMVLAPSGSAVPALSADAAPFGGGAAGAGFSQLPGQTDGVVAAPGGSVAGAQSTSSSVGGGAVAAVPDNGSATPQGAASVDTASPAAPASSSSAVPLVVLGLIFVGLLAAGWIVRSRRPRLTAPAGHRD